MEGVTAASAPCSGASGSPHPSTMSPVESAQARVNPVRVRELVAQAQQLQAFAGESINPNMVINEAGEVHLPLALRHPWWGRSSKGPECARGG
jgi:hypothetical protein